MVKSYKVIYTSSLNECPLYLIFLDTISFVLSADYTDYEFVLLIMGHTCPRFQDCTIADNIQKYHCRKYAEDKQFSSWQKKLKNTASGRGLAKRIAWQSTEQKLSRTYSFITQSRVLPAFKYREAMWHC